MKAARIATLLVASIVACGRVDASPQAASHAASVEPTGGIIIVKPYSTLITVPSVPAAETTSLALPVEETFEAYSTTVDFTYPTNGWSHEEGQVETCTDLTLGDWTPLGDPVVGNGTTNTVFEPTGAFPRKFYRVTSVR